VTLIHKPLTWLILLLGLASSGAAAYWVKLDIDAREYQKFVYDCEEIQLKIIARLKAHEQTLLSGAALFDASKSVTRQEWNAYSNHLRLNEHFNGIQGLGFAKWIPAAQLSAHKAAIRAEGFPDYTVRPEGKREAYTSIIFIEPFTDRNLRAFGYDMYSEPVRHVAMARARDENSVTLSGRVTLVQETDKNVQAGTLMYVPVYHKNQTIDTLEHRRAALFGWVYSPFRMTDLLNNIVLPRQETKITPVYLHVYEGRDTLAEHLLYDNDPAHSDDNTKNQRLLVEMLSEFNGTAWTLQFEKTIVAGDLSYLRVWITLGTGIVISFLLFLLSHSYLSTRIKAFNIAARLTKELQESENRFRVLADHAPVLIWIAGLNKLCYQFNKAWLDFTGRSLEQEYGNGWLEGVHPDDMQQCLDIYVGSFDARLPFTMEYRLRRYDGEYRWLLDNGIPRFADDGTFLGYIGSCIDITEKKQIEHALQQESEKNTALLHNASDGIHILDIEGNIIEVSDSFCQMLGYSRDETVTMNISQYDVQFAPDECIRLVKQQFEKTPVRSLFETRHRCKDGTIIDVEVSCFPLMFDGKAELFCSSRDISERKNMEEYINHLAFYDALTQLPNRRLLHQRIKHGIEINHRTGSQMAVLMLDLDKFKVVNDTLGHTAGDELLQQVATRITDRLREVDMVARLGGDEFIIILDDIIGNEHVAQVAQSIIDALTKPFTLGSNQVVYIGASIGIALHPQHGGNEDELIDNADAALYHAKEQGRGCFVYFSKALTLKK
jgi:diguanylate cyclase (GGDEF)-like protein/PAS domain S-box-containing protein